jgi:hypothetical protein
MELSRIVRNYNRGILNRHDVRMHLLDKYFRQSTQPTSKRKWQEAVRKWKQVNRVLRISNNGVLTDWTSRVKLERLAEQDPSIITDGNKLREAVRSI